MTYRHIQVPTEGDKIQFGADGRFALGEGAGQQAQFAQLFNGKGQPGADFGVERGFGGEGRAVDAGFC